MNDSCVRFGWKRNLVTFCLCMLMSAWHGHMARIKSSHLRGIPKDGAVIAVLTQCKLQMFIASPLRCPQESARRMNPLLNPLRCPINTGDKWSNFETHYVLMMRCRSYVGVAALRISHHNKKKNLIDAWRCCRKKARSTCCEDENSCIFFFSFCDIQTSTDAGFAYGKSEETVWKWEHIAPMECRWLNPQIEKKQTIQFRIWPDGLLISVQCVRNSECVCVTRRAR